MICHNASVQFHQDFDFSLTNTAYAASQTTKLHMKRLNKTESPISFFCVFFVSKGNLLDFCILLPNEQLFVPGVLINNIRGTQQYNTN